MLLFAETSNGQLAVVITLAGLVGGAITWVATEWKKVRDERRADCAAEEKTITDHLNKLIERLDRENALKEKEKEELEKEFGRLLARVTRREVLIAALRAHVRYIEGLLKDKGILFFPHQDPPESKDPDSSGQHTPLEK